MKFWKVLFWVLLVGCSYPPVSMKTLKDLSTLQTTSSYHPLFYIGSDSQYHYFSYLNGKYWESYKSPREQKTLSFEFEKGRKESKVMFPGTIESELGI